ncbi:SRPBCC family protein [Nitriliruptor alkaliphilus]|uniref:SRPBCC family protein n=1 Tax=Nitriliruptor alkaliphilus TaxID=427918 RepID=UPI000697ADC2|nr:SRPBCC family protein [Nitriliruptor alkaliphilus]
MPRTQQVSTVRVIAADRQAIFDVLADPAMHAIIDGSGTVIDVQDGGPARLAEGATFGMSMKVGAAYPILNTVVEFEEGVRIAWRHFHGHRWRYELEDAPEGGTRVTETFDWSTARTKRTLELAGIPRRNLKGMERTLEKLDEVVTGPRSATS